MSWYTRSLIPGDVHRGVLNQGDVHAVCGLKFFPLRGSTQVACSTLPESGQVCLKCTAQAPNQVVIPAVCSWHPEEVISLVVGNLGRRRITLDSPHTCSGCAFTLPIDPLFNTLGKWV